MSKRSKLKVTNDTVWSTRDLRKIFAKCLNEVRKTEKHHALNSLVVRVIYHKADWIGGKAWLNSGVMVIKIPHPRKKFHEKEKDSNILRLDFSHYIAKVFMHELGHCIGVRPHHNNMTIEKVYIDWIRKTFGNDTYPVRFKIPVPKAKPGVVEKRYGQAVVNLKKSKTRLKRAQTINKKWKNKVKYYENKMAAKGKE